MNPQNYTIFKGNPSELPDISIKFDPPPKWVPCNDPCFFLESATGPTLGCKHRTEHLKLQVAGKWSNGPRKMLMVGRFFWVQ